MADYPANEIVDMIMILGECGGVFVEAAALYAERFPNRRHPTNVTIRDLTARARNGRLHRQRRRHEYGADDVRVLVILALIHGNPHISSKQIERESGIPKQTVLFILKKLRYHAYHITLTQALTPLDFVARVQFCNWALQRIQQDPAFFNYVMFSDEATFKNTGELNRHNCHYWSDANPHWHRAIDHQHRWSVMVWCGILNGYLIGPYFFEGNVTGAKYLELLRDHLPVLLENVIFETRLRMIIQQDGAPPHFENNVRGYLNTHYPNRWIGRAGPNDLVLRPWPARSPDLTSPDFYLWGYLRDVVYRQEPTTRADMIDRIRRACEAIPRNVLLSTVPHFQRRLNFCIQENGGQFEQLLNG